MEERDVFIVSAVRTAIGVGKPGGALHEFLPVDLAAMIMKETIKRAGVEMDRIEDVLWGCVTPVGDQGANMARLAALKAGFPVEVPGTACAVPARARSILEHRPSWQATWTWS